MVDIKLLEDVLPDIDDWSYGDLKEIKLLTEDNIKEFTKDLDELCDNDILSLCATALYHMRKSTLWIDGNGLRYKDDGVATLPFKPCVIPEPYASKGTPLDIRYDTTGVEKCIPVTCEKQ